MDNEQTTKTLHTSNKHEHSNRLSLNSTHIWALKVSQEIAYFTTTAKFESPPPAAKKCQHSKSTQQKQEKAARTKSKKHSEGTTTLHDTTHYIIA